MSNIQNTDTSTSSTLSSNSATNFNFREVIVNMLPLWLLIAATGLDFLSHIPLGGDYSNRLADNNLWRSNHIITNAVFYVIGIWSLAKLVLDQKKLKSLLNPIILCFFAYCAVIGLSLIFIWPFKLPSWDTSQTYPTTMLLRLLCFFLAICAMHSSSLHSLSKQALSKQANNYTYIKRVWNILLGFFAIRLCLVWIQSLLLKFPSNPANPATETQVFLTKQLELLFDGRLFYPIRAKGLEFPFLYGPLNANESATIAIILFCTALVRLFNLKENNANAFHILIWIFVGLLSLVTIIFTHSSTALVLLVIATPLILFLNKRGAIVAIAVFLIAAFAMYFDQPIQSTLGQYLGRGESVVQRVTDLGGRSYIWEKAFTHIQEKPLFGHGYETNRFVIGRPLKDVAPYNDPGILHAHNTYISVLVENGIVGLVPLALAVILLWISVIKKLRQNQFNSLSQEMFLLLLVVSFSSLVYIGFFNSVLIIYRWLMLIPLLLFAMSDSSRRSIID